MAKKRISFYERKFISPQLVKPAEKLYERKQVTSEDIVNGVKVTKVEIKDIPLEDINKGLKWYDFSIDSLAAAGAVELMKFSQLEQNRFDIVDRLSGQVDNLPDAQDDVQAMVNDDKNIE